MGHSQLSQPRKRAYRQPAMIISKCPRVQPELRYSASAGYAPVALRVSQSTTAAALVIILSVQPDRRIISTFSLSQSVLFSNVSLLKRTHKYLSRSSRPGKCLVYRRYYRGRSRNHFKQPRQPTSTTLFFNKPSKFSTVFCLSSASQKEKPCDVSNGF